eukprot:IDg18384t1
MTASNPRAVHLAIDNQGALAIARKHGLTKRSKYIDVRHHLLRDLTAQRIIRPYFMPSARLSADAKARPLNSELFERHRRRMQVIPLVQPSTAAVG